MWQGAEIHLSAVIYTSRT